MKTRWLFLALLLLLGGTVTAQAGLDFTLTPDTLTLAPGSTIAFHATLENTGSTDLYLNLYAVNWYGAALLVRDEAFYQINNGNPMAAGQKWQGPIFGIEALSSAPIGEYWGNFTFLNASKERLRQ